MKITVAVCITVLLCLVIGVGGFLAHRGTAGPEFFQLLTMAGTGIGLLANLARTEYVAQLTNKVDEQTNGSNHRLQRIADNALAELPPDQARDVLKHVDTPDDVTHHTGPEVTSYDPRQ